MTVEEDLHQAQKYPTMKEVVEEMKKLMEIGLPTWCTTLVGYVKNMVLVACMGRLGSLELAGGSLAIGFTNITGYSVLSGLALGMEPLCSQAFGSNNRTLVSLTLKRTILMLLFASMCISILWFYTEPLMLRLHQNPDITHVAGLYCRFAIPDLIANSLLHPLRIYLRSKGTTTWSLMWCALVAVIFQVPITFFLAFRANLGVVGIAISTFVSNFINLVFLLAYLVYIHVMSSKRILYVPFLVDKDEVTIPSSGVQEWGMLLKFAIPSCLGVCLEWWWYEFMTLSAGYLNKPHVALATSAIVIQTTSLLYTCPAALSASVSTRVGNELGAGRPTKARLAAVCAIGLALVIPLIGLIWTTTGRETWANVFTNDREIIELSMIVLPMIGLCELANCPQTTSCGVLRGSARPAIGAGINFCSFYLVGAPVALVLSFVWELGFVGLCYGLLAAQVTCAVSILAVIYKTNWERESLKAKYLVGLGNVEDDLHHHQILNHDCEQVEFVKEETTCEK